MVHAFLLVLILGDIEQRGQPMYFRSIETCNWFAGRIVKRYGNYGSMSSLPKKHQATAYCKPEWINSTTEGLY